MPHMDQTDLAVKALELARADRCMDPTASPAQTTKRAQLYFNWFMQVASATQLT